MKKSLSGGADTLMLDALREFSLSVGNFRHIQTLAYEITGISLSDHKHNMIYSRLARRLRALNLKSFDEYCALLDAGDAQEVHEFVNAITTNLTAFFRESHHFEFLRTSVLPSIVKKKGESRRIRIWSAGCSTGEEPYSLAMVIKSFPALKSWDVKILATDLDSNVIATAKTGIYSLDRAAKIADEHKKYFLYDKASQRIKVKDAICDLITFKQLNLLHDWPMKGTFDVIFCRNVVIYFDAKTQRQLFDRYANILNEDGYLFIGHSENLHNISDRFTGLGRTVYQRSR